MIVALNRFHCIIPGTHLHQMLSATLELHMKQRAEVAKQSARRTSAAKLLGEQNGVRCDILLYSRRALNPSLLVVSQEKLPLDRPSWRFCGNN
jgi:hypothetical protein